MISPSFSLCLSSSGGTWRKARRCRPSTRREPRWRGSTSRPTSPPSSPSTASASSTSCRGWRDDVFNGAPKKNGEKNTRIRPNTTDCEQKWACLVAIRTLKPPLITLFSQKFTFPLHSFHVRADTSQALQRSITDIYSLFCRIKRSEKMQIHVFVDKTHQRFLWSNKERHIKNLKNQHLWLSGLLRQIVWSINP